MLDTDNRLAIRRIAGKNRDVDYGDRRNFESLSIIVVAPTPMRAYRLNIADEAMNLVQQKSQVRIEVSSKRRR
jgi:hypothetical protein